MLITTTAILEMRMLAKTLKCEFTLLQMHVSAVVIGKCEAESCQLHELPLCARSEKNATVSTSSHSATPTQISPQPSIF